MEVDDESGLELRLGEDPLRLLVEASNSNRNSRAGTTSPRNRMEELQLKRARGKLIVSLFNANPILQETAQVRLTETVQERTKVCALVADRVNEEFGESLGYLTIERLKKLQLYYKKKFENDPDVNGVPGEDPPEDDAAAAAAEEERKDLQSLLEQHIEQVLAEPIQGERLNPSRMSELRRERTEFVFNLTKFYHDRMCFKDKQKSLRFGRSMAVNAERLLMWQRVTEKVNEKYENSLGKVDLEQVKKIYTNRISRPRRLPTDHSFSMDYSSSHSGSSPPPEDIKPTIFPFKDIKLETCIDEPTLPLRAPSPDKTSSSDKLQELLRGLDRSEEVSELKEQLVARDREIERLKKNVFEQAEEYRQRFLAVLELVKVGVNEQTALDVAKFLQFQLPDKQ